MLGSTNGGTAINSLSCRDYAGAIHVHTNFSSDSEISVEELICQARRAKLDFVIVTDHNTVAGKRYEGWHHGLLLIVGEEISPPGLGHYLAFAISDEIQFVGSGDVRESCQALIDKVAEANGFGFIAHPFFEKPGILGVRGCPWPDWNVSGFTGITVFDYTSDGASRLSILGYLFFSLFPFLDVDRPQASTLAKWDELLAQGKNVVGIGTVDAHLFTVKIGKRRVPVHPFHYFLTSIRTHILSLKPFQGDSETDIGLVYDCLRQGACYISNDYLGDPRGFWFDAVTSTDRKDDVSTTAIMGQSLAISNSALLRVRVPVYSLIRLIRNGRVVSTKWGRGVDFAVSDPGAYRVEVFKRHFCRLKPWIFSNAIMIARREVV